MFGAEGSGQMVRHIVVDSGATLNPGIMDFNF